MVCRGVAAFVVAAGGLMPAPIAQASVFEMPAGQTSLLMVPVGDAGNAADTTGNGSVAYDYQIGEYDVTAAQYCQFLNATAATNDPYSLWTSNAVSSDNFNMTNDASEGITRSGSAGNYTFSVKTGQANNPAIYVTLYDALRFANWLNNGQGDGSTETGSYTLTGSGPDWTVTVPSAAQRAAWATSYGLHWVIPDTYELYKADFYVGGGTNAGYWKYGTKSNTAPASAAPSGTPNTANYYNGSFALTGSPGQNSTQDYLTNVGAYYNSPGPYGTYDVEGPVTQWTDTINPFSSGYATAYGGNWYYSGNYFVGDGGALSQDDTPQCALGFRVEAIGLGYIPGDANGDGRVDVNDLTIVLSNFGQTGTGWAEGEFTGSGTVDVNDLTIVLASFGRSVAAGVAAVPEPGTLIALAAGLVGLLAYAWRKQK